MRLWVSGRTTMHPKLSTDKRTDGPTDKDDHWSDIKVMIIRKICNGFEAFPNYPFPFLAILLNFSTSVTIGRTKPLIETLKRKRNGILTWSTKLRHSVWALFEKSEIFCLRQQGFSDAMSCLLFWVLVEVCFSLFFDFSTRSPTPVC